MERKKKKENSFNSLKINVKRVHGNRHFPINNEILITTAAQFARRCSQGSSLTLLKGYVLSPDVKIKWAFSFTGQIIDLQEGQAGKEKPVEKLVRRGFFFLFFDVILQENGTYSTLGFLSIVGNLQGS